MKKPFLFLMIVLFCLLAAGCKAPQSPAQQETDTVLSFTSKDINGDQTGSNELFAANKITMINVFASWCGPCVRELPELQELSGSLEQMGCGLIGILDDGDTAECLESGKDLVSSNGITYPVIISNDEIRKQLPLQYYPTTFFVDSSGHIVGEPIIGAQVDKYLPAVQKLIESIDG